MPLSRSLFLALCALTLFATSAFAQPSTDCNPDPNAGAEGFKVCSKIYCRQDTAQFELSVDTDNCVAGAGCNILLAARFNTKAPAKKLKVLLADGSIVPGQGKFAKVGKMNCSGQNCLLSIDNDLLGEIAEKSDAFDLDATFTNIVLRKGLKDTCIGKLTNNLQSDSATSAINRYFCSFSATGETSLEGEGFFDPFGLEDGSQWNFQFAGGNTGDNLKLCRLTGNKYRSIAEGSIISEGTADTAIYKSLSEEEQSLLSSSPDLYSYNFLSSVESSERALSKSISAAFNKTIGSSVGKKTLKKASKQRRKRRRDKKKKFSRRSLPAETLPRATKKQEFVQWLSFDPNADTLYAASNCKGDVPANAYGTISCNSTSADGKKCVQMTASSPDPENPFYGVVCAEQRTGFDLLTVRVIGPDAGQYSLCLDGSADSNTITVDPKSSGNFGQVELTSSSAAAQAVERFGFTTADIPGIAQVGLSADGDCENVIISGTLSGS